ncbi:MAG: flavodoxin-dependent (E)-4-hydroxy-3-methylbut-2-enyl-diphosphate synthase [Clostridia bacterium]|nr:flavodoxin-dependent (E)-4-hydroxy-3-methylbut-2-enyl-diphosphate synthase [Clostridia bacterium]
MDVMRRKTRAVRVGDIMLGGDSRIAIQSMCNTPARDIDAGVRQALEIEAAGCDILRFAVPDIESVDIFRRVREAGVKIPLVADIHFDWKLAVACAERGADKIRINPGNIGGDENVKRVVEACRAHGLPIRIGVNSGSLQKEILEKYGSPTAEALAESALLHASLLEKFDFYDTVISIKSSDPVTMIRANRILEERCDYPLHLGVTEAGSERLGTVKSSVGIGSLLCDGIGDTVRVSLTADPVKEIRAAKELLSAVGYDTGMINVVSCPTCGRTGIDLISIVNEFEERAFKEAHPSKQITVALMGCVVNGLGEAREADIGFAGGRGEALLFRHGEVIRKIDENNIVGELIAEINKL